MKCDLRNPANSRWLEVLGTAILVAFVFTGCDTPKTTKNINQFESAGYLWPEVELTSLAQKGEALKPYRIVPRDVLEIHLPYVTRTTVAVAKSPGQLAPEAQLFRVARDGTITLPLVGRVSVVNQTLNEIENTIANAYHPAYLHKRPTIVAVVKEYHTVRVSISGAVNEPGTYELRSNEMSLMALLMKAGGISKEGAKSVRVQCDTADDLVLPTYGLHFPPSDVQLYGGESVLVEQLDPQLFTVIGLVRIPGAHPYPPHARYSLHQAIAIAGGVNDVADPHYAKVYRSNGNGIVAVGCFKLTGNDQLIASQIEIKPGDIVSLEHTTRTRIRVLLAEIMRIGAGLNIGASYNPAD